MQCKGCPSHVQEYTRDLVQEWQAHSLDLLVVDLPVLLAEELVVEAGTVGGWLPVVLTLLKETPVMSPWTVGGLCGWVFMCTCMCVSINHLQSLFSYTHLTFLRVE